MSNNTIDWTQVPEIMSKEQFRILCHISKATAKYLLEEQKVPCVISSKSTHKYKIKKSDVQEYLRRRDEDSERYAAPSGAVYRRYSYNSQIPPDADMLKFFTVALQHKPDVMKASYISQLTGYQQSTVARWHKRGFLKGFYKGNTLHVPKIYLIEFFNSPYFRNIQQKNDWHRQVEKKYIDEYLNTSV